MDALLNIAKKATTIISPVKKASFKDVGTDDLSSSELLLFLITTIILLFIIIYCGCIIYNDVALKAVPSLHKLSTFQFFGLYILTHILFT
jgi:hypothetical protein